MGDDDASAPVVVDAQWGGPPTRPRAEQPEPPPEVLLVAEHDADVVKTKLELIEKRGAEHDALMARVAEKRAAQLVKAKERLAAEGATQAVEAMDAAAARAAEREALQREELREELNLEKELEQAAAARRAEARANHVTALSAAGAAEESARLTAQHEEEMELVHQEMDKKKASQKEALQARLAAKRAAATEAQGDAAAGDELAEALKAAGASPEVAAEIAAEHASTERDAATEREELDKRIAQEVEAALAKARAEFDEQMAKLRRNQGLSTDHEGRVVDKKTGLHADGRTHAYNDGHEIESLLGKSGRHHQVFRGTGGLRDQRIARAQGRCDTRRERAARNAQKELLKAQAAFQRAAGSVIGTVTSEKMAKFMWEFDKIKVSEQECAAIMVYADTNHNGVLDAQEIPAAIQIWKQIQESADLLDEHAGPLTAAG